MENLWYIFLYVTAFFIIVGIVDSYQSKKSKKRAKRAAKLALKEREANAIVAEPAPIVRDSDILRGVSFVAIDFETANRRRGSACAIGMSKVINGEVVDRYVKYLRPEPFEFEEMNVYVHGIDEDKTAFAPTIGENWENIKAFVGKLPLVAHNASFDRSVLEQSLAACGCSPSSFRFNCTMQQAKRLFPNRGNYKLPDLCVEYGIELSHHDAGSDAEACALLMLKLLLLGIETPFTKQNDKEPVERPILEIQSDALKGLKIVFTGDADSYTRSELEELAASHGALVRRSVSRKTDYVVRGNINASGKLTDADSLGIAVVTVKQFLKLIEKGVKKQSKYDEELTKQSSSTEDLTAQLNTARSTVSRLKRQIKELGEAATVESHPNYSKYCKLQSNLSSWEIQKTDLEAEKGGIVKRKIVN